MKTIIKGALIASAALMAFAFTHDRLAIGDKAPLQDYKMEDISGSMESLETLKKDNGLVVIFSCNTCPFVLGTEEIYNTIGTLGVRNNIGVALINSNEGKRPGDDDMSEMQKHAADKGYDVPYLLDLNNQLADAFGANTTPHVFLFNKDLELVYTGAIDDRFEQKSKKPTVFWLRDAMVNMISSRKRDDVPSTTKNIGCSIKRAKN